MPPILAPFQGLGCCRGGLCAGAGCKGGAGWGGGALAGSAAGGPKRGRSFLMLGAFAGRRRLTAIPRWGPNAYFPLKLRFYFRPPQYFRNIELEQK
jgi:hypothetical protein